MKTTKIFQVHGNGKAYYVATTSKTKALKISREIYPTEKITHAADWTTKFSKEELENLPEYIITE